MSLNFERSSKVQGRARRVHCSMCTVFSVIDFHQLQEIRTGHNSQETQSLLLLRPPYPPTYTLPIFFTKIILMADKHNIPKRKMHSNCNVLPDQIICKITQRNNIRRENTCDPALKLLNEKIASDIHALNQTKPLEGTSRCTPGSQTQRTHSMEDHTRSVQ